MSLTEHPAWKALEAPYDEIRNLHLRKLFADDPGRGGQMMAKAAGIYLDYSKNRIIAEGNVTFPFGRGGRYGRGKTVSRRQT